MREPRFVDRLHAFLREELIPVDDYPGLQLLCWNRRAPYVTRREAFALYERNWRFVDARATPEHERTLIDVLARKFGHGLSMRRSGDAQAAVVPGRSPRA